MCVCVRVDLLDRSKTCTVSAGRHSISLGLCPTELPVIWDTGSDQSIVSAFWDEHCHGDVENLLLCLVLLFLFSSYCFHSWNMEWEYVAPRHLVCQCFVQVRGWVGDLLPKALKLCFGVSFGYRFAIVFSPWPSIKKCLQIRIITVTHASSNQKINEYMYIVFCIRGSTRLQC